MFLFVLRRTPKPNFSRKCAQIISQILASIKACPWRTSETVCICVGWSTFSRAMANWSALRCASWVPACWESAFRMGLTRRLRMLGRPWSCSGSPNCWQCSCERVRCGGSKALARHYHRGLCIGFEAIQMGAYTQTAEKPRSVRVYLFVQIYEFDLVMV